MEIAVRHFLRSVMFYIAIHFVTREENVYGEINTIARTAEYEPPLCVFISLSLFFLINYIKKKKEIIMKSYEILCSKLLGNFYNCYFIAAEMQCDKSEKKIS